MKHPILLACLALYGLTFLPGTPASAQVNKQSKTVPGNNSQGNNSGNRLYNPFHVEFRRSWDALVPDPVKLIEIAPVTDTKRNNLLLLVGGKSKTDTQRQLRVTHWDGFRFSTDGEVAIQSITLDMLLTGRFHPGNPTLVTPSAAPTPVSTEKKAPKKPKPASDSRGLQVVINAGVYIWANSTLTRLASAPPDAKIALLGQDRPLDQLVGGAGDAAVVYEFSATDLHTAAPQPLGGNGYTRFGVGTQDFSGSEAMNLAPGIRYIQSVWSGRSKWMIGLARGAAAPTLEAPNATTGDRLVVYTPKFANRDKTFWSSRTDDMEEAWRSEPLPGRVLDVRVGDPKNDGKSGILVLTSENNDKDRHLYFFVVNSVG